MTTYERSILVTGGTSGLGYHAAAIIAKQYPKYQIIIAARSDSANATAQMNKQVGANNVHFMSLDLSSMEKVRLFAAQWKSKSLPPIQSLVFNAALQFPEEIHYSDDGFEKTFAISHVGHALLFSLLRPYLADDARIAIVASGVHDPAQKSGLPDAHFESAEDFAHPPAEIIKKSGRQHYSNTKLANIYFTYALHRRLEAINKSSGKRWTVNAMDPGLMPGTGLAREAGPVLKFLWHKVLPRITPLLRLIMGTDNVHTPQESGAALARVAVGSDLENVSGLYFEGKKEIKSSEESYDEKKQEQLWQWTMNTIAKTDEEKREFGLSDLA